VTPAPSPFERPIRIIKSGVMNPTAARASAPSPAIQTASARLYVAIRSMAMIIGPESFLIAVLGSPGGC